ncbi:MAG: flagellar biosynthesis protein FlhF [Lachnospiraceae bacterium]|nr:flagellar biosynthesis protein FlhF [Lachnospiraceae bacterium]
MVIKKYIAETEDEAIALARDELGSDAVIMNVKRSVPKGIYKFIKKTSVEITAAVDDAPQEEDKPDFSKLQEAIRNQEPYAAPDSKAARQEEQREKLLQSDQIISEDLDAESVKDPVKEQQAIEEKLSSLQNLLEKQVMHSQDAGEKSWENPEEKEEEPQDKLGTYFQLIRDKMLDNEVLEEYVDQIIQAVETGKRKDWTLDNILAGVYQKIILKIGQPHLIDVRTKKTKYIFFIGPTGVGKTTTIAKIASTLKLTKKTKVALITSDTYRIAAVEQLKTYANILGIPLEVVYSAEEMEKTMDKLKDYDLVLVDTAGRSHQNSEQIHDIRNLLQKVPDEDKEVYLVLSATTKYKDLVNISQAYSKITEYFLVFTKLDETDTVGNIFNIRMLTGASLSYATWGQNVPDDIGKIDAQKMTKQLLGGNS